MAEQLAGPLPEPRYATFRRFRDGNGDVIDEGLLLFFPAPHSFTGEDVVEFQGHGGRVVLDLLLQRMLALGARLARPGEFSERAFLNDRMDLVQAEAVADIIDAGSTQAARAALRSLQGVFSREVHELVEELIQLRIYVEAAIDFPEEEVDFLSDRALRERLSTVRARFDALSRNANQGRLLHDGLTVVIAGPPNAGKSSLLNALAGSDAAIVTDIPGTTRDVLREQIQLDGMPLHIVDTAGLRESSDQVEAEGIRRARREMAGADRVLFVIDSAAVADHILEPLLEGLPITVVRNKIDVSGESEGLDETTQPPVVRLSVKTGKGIDALRHHLQQVAGYHAQEAGAFSARRRHIDALLSAQKHVETGAQALLESRAGEVLAEELRLAQRNLGEITGEFGNEELLGRIFSNFCIGK